MSNRKDLLAQGLKLLSSAKWSKLKFEAPVRLGKLSAKSLTIGAWSYIQSGAALTGEVRIGRYCSIAENLLAQLPEHPTHWLSTSTSQYQRSQFDYWMQPDLPLRRKVVLPPRSPKVIIGNDVWIGRNVILMRGINIGNGVIIAAGAIVTRDVPPYAIVGGIPAKVIRYRYRYRFEEDLIQRLQASEWWQYDRNDLQKDIAFEEPDHALDQIEEMVKRGVLLPRPVEYHEVPAS